MNIDDTEMNFIDNEVTNEVQKKEVTKVEHGISMDIKVVVNIFIKVLKNIVWVNLDVEVIKVENITILDKNIKVSKVDNEELGSCKDNLKMVNLVIQVLINEILEMVDVCKDMVVVVTVSIKVSNDKKVI